jgi:GT2 family glycosyltransferase
MNKSRKEDINNKLQISLILVTMNRKEILKRCLESLRLQNFTNYEIIIVDNASNDGTGNMVQRSFPEVRYFYISKNLGVPGGRNYGAQMSAGEFLVFLDDDAIFADDKALSQVVPYFSSDSKLGCIGFRIVQPSDNCEEYKSIPRSDKKVISEDYECSYFCGAGFACRWDLFLDMGMFWDDLFFIGEELDFSYRLVNEGYKIIRSSAITVIHYETPQARMPGKLIYFGTRSRVLVAARNLPWINVFSHTLLWWGKCFVSALRHRHLIYFIQGVKDAIIDFPKAVRIRSCITKETVAKLKKLSGRIYY